VSAAPTEVIELVAPERLDTLVEEWRALAAEVPESSYFQTPDWVLGWWETVAGRPPTEIATWRDPAGNLEAVVALSLVRERVDRRLPLAVEVWTNAGGGAGSADHGGWPVLPHRAEDVRAWLARPRGTLKLANLDPVTGAPFVPPGARLLGRSCCPRLAIPPEGAPLGRSAHFRKRLRAAERRVGAAGVTFRAVPPEEFHDPLLETLLDLHEARRTLLGASSNFTREALVLHRRLIARSGRGRGPGAVVAEHGGQAIGIVYGFWWRDVFATYQGGWRPEWARSGLAMVLEAHTIELAQAAGARVYDLLRGADEFKHRLGAEDRFDETWLLPHGAGGRLIVLRHRLRTGRGVVPRPAAKA
jgi:CelD/BcsL family acetyltransferase involved in cellulose biosynthesis